MFPLKLFIKTTIFGLITVLIALSLKISYTSPYYESEFKQYFKQSVAKIEQFSDSFLIDNQLLDFPNTPFLLYNLQEKSYEKYHFPQNSKNKKELKPYDLILFVPGHKGSYTQIIQFQGYLYEKFKSFQLNSFFFKFYAIDYNEAPSAFSENLVEKQSDYIISCLKYLFNQCTGKEQKISLITHSMGGLAVMLALQKLVSEKNSYVLKKIEKIIFLNSPLGEHPINIDFNLQRSYSKIYGMFEKIRKQKIFEKNLEKIIFLSFSGNKGDFEVNGEISRLKLTNYENNYFFFTNNLREVYLHLSHVETLTNPFFLFKLSEFLIDYYINKVNKISFNFYWYFQHLNLQIHSVKIKTINETEGFDESFTKMLEFIGRDPNFQNFKIDNKFCKLKKKFSFGTFNDSCIVLQKNSDEVMNNLWIRTESNQKTIRIVLYYKDLHQNIEKIIIFSPEFKFNYFPEAKYKYIYHLHDNLLNLSDFKLFVMKSIHDTSFYQIMTQNKEIQRNVTLIDLFQDNSLFINNLTGHLINIDFNIPYFIDPLFLKIIIKVKTEFPCNEIILLIWNEKNLDIISTNLKEIQISSMKNQIDHIQQVISYPNQKILHIVFPLLKDATAEISFEISLFEIAHYLGRTLKQEVLSMIVPLAFVIVILQFVDLWRNIKTEHFLKKIWKNFFFIIFIWGNWNLFYIRNGSELALNKLGIYNGGKLENYRIWSMIFLVPSATLTVTVGLSFIFTVFFKIMEIFSIIILKLFKRFKNNQIFWFLAIFKSLFLGFSLAFEIKWLLFPFFLLCSILFIEFKKQKTQNYPVEISETILFISFMYFFMNFNKILLFIEHFSRNDDFLKELLENDDDMIKFLALQSWCLMAESINVGKSFLILFVSLSSFMVLIMFLLGSGKVYLINYLLTYFSFPLMVFNFLIK